MKREGGEATNEYYGGSRALVDQGPDVKLRQAPFLLPSLSSMAILTTADCYGI